LDIPVLDLEEKLKSGLYRIVANLSTGLDRQSNVVRISQPGAALGADDLQAGAAAPTAAELLLAKKAKFESGGKDDGGPEMQGEFFVADVGDKFVADDGDDLFSTDEVVDTPAEVYEFNVEVIENVDFLLNLVDALVQERGETISSFNYNESLRNKIEFSRAIRSDVYGGRDLPFPLYSLYEKIQSEIQSPPVSSNARTEIVTEIENAIYLSMIRLRFSNIAKVQRMTGFESMPGNPNLLNLKKINYIDIDEDFINGTDRGDFICRLVKFNLGNTNSLWYVNNNNLLNFNIENNIFRIIK
jgi:hypothetical protein